VTGSSVGWRGIQKMVEILLHEIHNERIILLLLFGPTKYPHHMKMTEVGQNFRLCLETF
jgi:hypothetical protein